jgi:hypothetical protein
MDAFRRVTQRHLPDAEETARAVRTRVARRSQEVPFMKLIRLITFRPMLATSIGIVAIAVILLAVPITYDQTIGYQVKLQVPAIEPAQAAVVSGELGRVLNTRDCGWSFSSGVGAVISARVPFRSQRDLEGLTAGYKKALAARGIEAGTEVTPIRRRVSGNVYEAAANGVHEVRVNREGKTIAQIEAEIREQLAASGLPGADVRVSQQGDSTHIQMEWTAPPGDSSSGQHEIHVRLDGKPGP